MGSILYAHLYVELDNLDQSKQGRPPRNSEKGAVRCCRRAMRGYNSGLYYASESSLVLQTKSDSGFPVMYTDVSQYMDWISNVTNATR